ncbi:MAG TPA: hypothetical protein VF165_22045 [Nocardioidaceae bacterium]
MSAAEAARVGTGFAFVVMPLVFVFAFATHPGLLHPRLLRPEQLIDRARGRRLLHAGHGLVTINTALMIVVALHLGGIVTRHGAGWAGLLGTLLAVLGTVSLAADKGALCLTMSALDGLSDDEFTAARPALSAIFAKKGWLWLLWGILLVPIGFAVLAIAALASGATSAWVAVPLLVGVLLIGTPDGAEIVNLAAAVTMAAGLVPFGLAMIFQ